MRRAYSSFEIQNPAFSRSSLAISGASGSNPRRRASINAPMRPTVFIPRFLAAERPRRSSISRKSAPSSFARTMASDSPAPRSCRRRFVRVSSLTECVSTQSACSRALFPALSSPDKTSSLHTAFGIMSLPKRERKSSRRSILAKAIRGEASETTIMKGAIAPMWRDLPERPKRRNEARFPWCPDEVEIVLLALPPIQRLYPWTDGFWKRVRRQAPALPRQGSFLPIPKHLLGFPSSGSQAWLKITRRIR